MSSALVDGRDLLDPAQLAAALGALGIGDVGTFTLATLPDPALWPRRTAWALDLFNAGNVDPTKGGRMVSEGGFWKPLRPLSLQTMSVATSATVLPLVHGTTIIGTGTLTVGMTSSLTLGAGSGYAVPYPGYRQRIVKPAGALGTLNVISAVVKALTGWADFEWDGAAWQQTASGGLL